MLPRFLRGIVSTLFASMRSARYSPAGLLKKAREHSQEWLYYTDQWTICEKSGPGILAWDGLFQHPCQDVLQMRLMCKQWKKI